MRWERLFDDLDGQVAAAEALELAGEVGERARIEQGRLALLARLRAAAGTRVGIGVAGQQLAGTVTRVAADALVLEADHGDDLLVALHAVAWVRGLGRPVAAGDPGPVAAGLGLRSLLRALARDRVAVRVRLRDGTSLTGTVDAVGLDWLELAEHPLDRPRRSGELTGRPVLALAALATVSVARDAAS